MDLHHADLAAHIARQPCVAGRIDVASADALADGEQRRRLDRARENALGLLARPHLICARGIIALRAARGRVAALDLIFGREVTVEQCRNTYRVPVIVVAARQIEMRRHQLADVAETIDVEALGIGHAARDAEHPCFPGRVPQRLVLLMLRGNRPVAVHAAHVVYAVHALLPFGASTLATPIIASRVTSSASSAWLRSSVPAGRSGNTR